MFSFKENTCKFLHQCNYFCFSSSFLFKPFFPQHVTSKLSCIKFMKIRLNFLLLCATFSPVKRYARIVCIGNFFFFFEYLQLLFCWNFGHWMVNITLQTCKRNGINYVRLKTANRQLEKTIHSFRAKKDVCVKDLKELLYSGGWMNACMRRKCWCYFMLWDHTHTLIYPHTYLHFDTFVLLHILFNSDNRCYLVTASIAFQNVGSSCIKC